MPFWNKILKRGRPIPFQLKLRRISQWPLSNQHSNYQIHVHFRVGHDQILPYHGHGRGRGRGRGHGRDRHDLKMYHLVRI